MENNVSPAKSGISYGVLYGVIMVLEFVIMYVIGMKSLVNTSFGVIVNVANYLVLPLIFIYIGCNHYKNKINGGYISFGQCLKVGVSIALVAAIIYAGFSVIFNLIFPEFIDEMVAISKTAMLKENPEMTSEQLEMGLSMMKKFSNPLIVFPVTLAMYSFLGLIYSLIIGAVVKNNKP
ncbi:DUF4199 domain-containing protein [Flavobacterium yafengii]|uniref:DUF4199 domain-containing protein n=1 Tax=Flavobacterium yafengii TaxID=3041253 RepID=UPI0024A994BC|nr:DUF4199 domain-containing protein [Flavobacterium yafengii]MDI5898338.1 DUF4199 domain-containing protein [Flavobacterium yafengii]